MKHILSLGAFLDFAKTKLPNETFNVMNFENCAWTQYCRAVGVQDAVKFPKTELGKHVVEVAFENSIVDYSSMYIKGRMMSWGSLIKALEG